MNKSVFLGAVGLLSATLSQACVKRTHTHEESHTSREIPSAKPSTSAPPVLEGAPPTVEGKAPPTLEGAPSGEGSKPPSGE